MKMFYGCSRTLYVAVLIAACPILFQHTCAENQFAPRVVLYEGVGGKGPSISSVSKNVPDLSALNFNDKAQSTCLKGVWIFYAEENYRNHSAGVSALFKNDGSCFNFQPLRRKVSSFRFAGSPNDFRRDILDLFDGILFTNAHLRTNADIPNLEAVGLLRVASAIVSGKSKWTLYEKPEYQGKSICVTPGGNNVPTFYKNPFDIGIDKVNEVQSLRKGCHPNPIGESSTTIASSSVSPSSSTTPISTDSTSATPISTASTTVTPSATPTDIIISGTTQGPISPNPVAESHCIVMAKKIRSHKNRKVTLIQTEQ